MFIVCCISVFSSVVEKVRVRIGDEEQRTGDWGSATEPAPLLTDRHYFQTSSSLTSKKSRFVELVTRFLGIFSEMEKILSR